MDGLAIKSLIPNAIAKDVIGLPFWLEGRLELSIESEHQNEYLADLQNIVHSPKLLDARRVKTKYLLSGDLPSLPRDSLFSIASKVHWEADPVNVIILLPQVAWSEDDKSYIALYPEGWSLPYIIISSELKRTHLVSCELPESPNA